jgi:hypothetical protein
MTKKIQTFTKLILCLFFSILLLSCRKDALSIEVQLKNYTGALKFEFLPESIEKVFSSEMPWESKTLNYYNIIQKDSAWNMWYNASAASQREFHGSFCFANSADGRTWKRPLINNNTNILIKGDNATGITGTFVFIDTADNKYPYRMICSKLVNGNQTTFLYFSSDGIIWKNYKQLYDAMQDSQFSVINFNGAYYVFLRYNKIRGGYQRAIGLSLLDKNLDIIQRPLLLLKADINSPYPHIYNSAASKINDSTVLLFPTYFDDESNTVRIKIIYTNNLQNYYLIDDNVNSKLFPYKKVNWAIVSPGVIPADEKNTYWVYYYGTETRHSAFTYLPKINVTYYRIKLVIHR